VHLEKQVIIKYNETLVAHAYGVVNKRIVGLASPKSQWILEHEFNAIMLGHRLVSGQLTIVLPHIEDRLVLTFEGLECVGCPALEPTGPFTGRDNKEKVFAIQRRPPSCSEPMHEKRARPELPDQCNVLQCDG